MPYWADRCGIAVNTLRSWIKHRHLPVTQSGGHLLISEHDLIRWLNDNQHLSAAGPALAALEHEGPTRSDWTADKAETGESPQAPVGPDRDQIRELRAQVATLDEQLEAHRRTVTRLRRERDQWRAAARAHRASLRAQLDLEERRDTNVESR